MENKKEVPQWIVDAQKKVFERKVEKAKQKYEEYAKETIDNLGELVDLYFKGYDFEDETENENNFNVLNEAWKEYCQRMKIHSKYISMKYDAFEVELKRYLESEEGKAYLEKIKELQSNPTEITTPIELINDPSDK